MTLKLTIIGSEKARQDDAQDCLRFNCFQHLTSIGQSSLRKCGQAKFVGGPSQKLQCHFTSIKVSRCIICAGGYSSK